MMNGFLSKAPFRPESHRRWRSTPSPCSYLPSPCAASTTSLPHAHLERDGMHRRKFVVRRKGRAGADKFGACHWIKCQARSGPRSSSHLLLRRSPFPHREAARCPARLGRSGVATCLNDERSFFESPSRTESHCRWRPTPSPFSRLLSHDLTHVRPPLRLPFTLILNAMACAGASRHLGRPHTLSQTLNHQSTQSRSLNHQRDHGARTP